MSEAITTARPYAQAAFEEAKKLNALKEWSEMLVTLSEAVCHLEVSAVINNPRVAKHQLEALLAALLGDTVSAPQQNFVRILVENKRLQVLPEISGLFQALKAEAEKTVNVIVDSALELSDMQKEKIVNALKKKVGREIKLTCQVNKELLGGIVIRAGDKVIDGSALARLGEMTNALA